VEATVEEAHVIQKGYNRNLSIGGLDSHVRRFLCFPLWSLFRKSTRI
jgi:hypothetical protein